MGGEPWDGGLGERGVTWGMVECAEDEEVVFGGEVWVVRTWVGRKRCWLLVVVAVVLLDKVRPYGCGLGGRRSWDSEVEGSRVGRVGVVGWLEISG